MKHIFYDAHTVKRPFAANRADLYAYRRDRMTGLIAAPMNLPEFPQKRLDNLVYLL